MRVPLGLTSRGEACSLEYDGVEHGRRTGMRGSHEVLDSAGRDDGRLGDAMTARRRRRTPELRP